MNWMAPEGEGFEYHLLQLAWRGLLLRGAERFRWIERCRSEV